MPRAGPRRPLVALRLADEGIAIIDQLAEQEGVNRSEMIRRLLDEAIANRLAARHRPEDLGIKEQP